MYSLNEKGLDTLGTDSLDPKWKSIYVEEYIPGDNIKRVYPIEKKWEESNLTSQIAFEYYPPKLDYLKTSLNYDPDGKKKNAAITADSNFISKGNNSGIGKWLYYNLTDYVRDVYDSARSNYGFTIAFERIDIERQYGFKNYIASSEYSDNSLRPKLIIKYENANSDYVSVKTPIVDQFIYTFYNFDIEWETNAPDKLVDITLLKGETFVKDVANNVSNNGKYKWTVPLDLESGSDYKISIKIVGNELSADTMINTFQIEKFHVIENLPYIQDFETEGIDNSSPFYWYSDYFSEFAWEINSGKGINYDGLPALSKVLYSGPEADHTTGNGFYIYMPSFNSSWAKEQKTGRVMTPVFNLGQNASLQFFFNRYSQFRYETSSEDTRLNRPPGSFKVEIYNKSKWTTIYEKNSDEQNEGWNEVNLALDNYTGYCQLRFSGTSPKYGYLTDFAIDDITIKSDPVMKQSTKIVYNTLPEISLINGILMINGCNNFKGLRVELFNIQGRKLLEINQGNSIEIIKLNLHRLGLSKGTYYVRVNNEKTHWMKKITYMK